MASIISADELKAVLGVGNLYADVDLEQVILAADAVIKAYLPVNDDQGTAIDWADYPAVVEAELTLSVDMWQNRVAPGGQMQAVDFTPSPYRTGRTMIQRIIGLLAPYMDNDGIVG